MLPCSTTIVMHAKSSPLPRKQKDALKQKVPIPFSHPTIEYTWTAAMHDEQNSFLGNDSTFSSRLGETTMTMLPGMVSNSHSLKQPTHSHIENSRLKLGNASHNLENSMYNARIGGGAPSGVVGTLGMASTSTFGVNNNAGRSTINLLNRPTSSGRLQTELNAKDRFIPRSANPGLRSSVQDSGVYADVFGVKADRVLEFGKNVPLQRKFAPAEFISQYAQSTGPTRTKTVRRYISTKPEKILDAPGLVDDFYLNVLDWSAQADIMAIGLGSTVYAWNPNSGEASIIADIADPSSSETNSGNSPVVTALKWSTEDSCLAISTSHGQVQLWDASTSTQLRVMKGGRRDRVACLSWNEHILSAGGRDGSIWNHDVRLKKHKVAELRGHTGEVCGLSWRSSDGRVLASGGNDNLVNIWDARISGTPQHQLTQHQAAVKALAWCPWQMNLLASGGGSADQHINFWNSTTGHRVKQIRTDAQVTSLHWSEEHQEIAATLGYPRNSVEIWSYPTLEPRAEISNAHDARILSATLSSNGQTLVTCAGDESIKMWNIFTTTRTQPRHRSLGSLSISRV